MHRIRIILQIFVIEKKWIAAFANVPSREKQISFVDRGEQFAVIAQSFFSQITPRRIE